MSRAYAYEEGKKGWIIPVSVQMIPAILLLIGVPFCIESPRWLIRNGRKARRSVSIVKKVLTRLQDEAIASLNKIRPEKERENGNTTLEADAWEQAIEETKNQSQGSWKELFSKTYINRTIIVALMFFFQQVTGQQFANSYGPS